MPPEYNEGTMLFRDLRRSIYHKRKALWRRSRILFPSPAELQFVRIMGGWIITIDAIKGGKNKYPLAIIVWSGRFLSREFMEREKRVGAYYIDFAFDTPGSRKGVEIDGSQYHMDIVKEQERDEYLASYGWKIMHVKARDLWESPYSVITRVRNFLS